MDRIDVLYDSALLHIARRIQSTTFYKQRVWVSCAAENITLMLGGAHITPRVKATLLLRTVLMALLSEDITTITVLKSLDQSRISKSCQFDTHEFKAFIAGGCDYVMQYHRTLFSHKLEECGVEKIVAFDLSALILLQRSTVIKHLNATDDVGSESVLVKAGT